MKWRLLVPASAMAVLLAACTTPAPRTVPPAAPAPSQPAPVASQPVPQPAPVETSPTPTPPPDTWQRLRASFAMHDCVAPAIRRASRETRNRGRFERRMQQMLPMIDYVQRAATRHGVAGELALLPWVESHFRQVPPRRHRPAGMWQIMPITARALHLDVSGRYDGRLDPVASTRAVMELVSAYYRVWHDWRLADMAYNTGEYRLRRILKTHGMPPGTPAIPDLPVGHVTRQHLTRLMAIACIIRDPQRFHVQLPALGPGQRLETVELPSRANLRQLARLVDLPSKRVRELNAGYRLAHAPAGSSLLLPVTAAQTLRDAIAAGRLHGDTRQIAAGNSGASTYTVASGDSLWDISRRFNIHVEQLRQWNDLDGSTLQPGQLLQLEPTPSS